jgi:predicted nucleic acid-binding Zn ribbon protein
MRHSNDMPLKEVIEEFINAFSLSDKLNEVEINNLWTKIAGKMISKHTKKLTVRNNKLFVELDSSALKQELSFSKSKILDKINSTLEKDLIEDIVFI